MKGRPRPGKNGTSSSKPGKRTRLAPKDPRLRTGYRGFCPLTSQQGELLGGGGLVERRPFEELDPASFFEQFVLERRPLVIRTGGAPAALEALFGLRGEAARWASPGHEAR